MFNFIKKLSIYLTFVISASMLLSACSGNNAKSSTVSDLFETSAADITVSYSRAQIGQTSSAADGLSVTVTNWEEYKNDSVRLADGEQLRKIYVTVANNTNEKLAVSTLRFKYREAGSEPENSAGEFIGAVLDDMLTSGQLEPGQSVSGALLFRTGTGAGALIYITDSQTGPEFEIEIE